jgi:hypothetical protein
MENDGIFITGKTPRAGAGSRQTPAHSEGEGRLSHLPLDQAVQFGFHAVQLLRLIVDELGM